MHTTLPAAMGALAVLGLASAGCDRGSSNDDSRDEADKRAQHLPQEISWLEDDYPAALEAARERGVPLVVVLWAPWCHTCLSMHNEVLPDPGLKPLATRFEWLMIDTDREVNAPVLDRLSIEVWPTSYVLSPDETVQARLTSAASVEQFRDFLLEGERAHLDAAEEAGELDEESPLYHARLGDRALAQNDYAAALDAYERALELAPEAWPRTPDVLVSYMHASMRAGTADDCAYIAQRHVHETGTSTSAVRFSRYVHWCGQGQATPSAQRGLFELADERLTDLLAGQHQLSADDQSTALRTRRLIHEDLGDEDAARALAERQRELLDQAAEEAIGPFAASTYSWPRSEVYTYLGAPEELVPDLVELAEELPENYDPPYRAAWLALRADDLETARTWGERAQELAYGPRKVQILELLIEIHGEAGDRDAERASLERLAEHLESLPASQRDADKATEVQERLQAIADTE